MFPWNPGDFSDSIDGGSEADTLVFNGAGAAEQFDITAIGGGFNLTRDAGGVFMTVLNQVINFTNFEIPNVVNPCAVPTMDPRMLMLSALTLTLVGAGVLRARAAV